MIDQEKYFEILKEAESKKAVLVAVSKTKPVDSIRELYALGQRDFGENYVQELMEKQEHLPSDIRWHFIGHLQTNKVKYISPFIHLIQGVDSHKLLREINKQGQKIDRVINVLLQVHIAQEETKFGWSEKELHEFLASGPGPSGLEHIKVCGLMGMASFTEDQEKIRMEFRSLKSIFDRYARLSATNHHQLSTLSMGMSSDYRIALEEGSTMIRIGSLIFGERKAQI